MAKFRQAHGGGDKSRRGGSTMVRVVFFLAILCALIFALLRYLPTLTEPQEHNDPPDMESGMQVRNFLPTTNFGDVLHHTFYSISYSERHEQPEWVAYEMTRDMLNSRKVERTDWFEADPTVPGGSAHFEDYRSSGYTKGHLAPAGDMAFSQLAMEESFLMSNISPQLRAFNGGVWRELEENVRDWARKYEHLYIVTGPILKKGPVKKIGRNQVAVPDRFYKVLLHEDGNGSSGIGFIIPHEMSEKPLTTYMVSIDDVERLTGLDFFGNVLQDSIEEVVESRFEQNQWPIQSKRYDLRVRVWNNR